MARTKRNVPAPLNLGAESSSSSLPLAASSKGPQRGNGAFLILRCNWGINKARDASTEACSDGSSAPSEQLTQQLLSRIAVTASPLGWCLFHASFNFVMAVVQPAFYCSDRHLQHFRRFPVFQPLVVNQGNRTFQGVGQHSDRIPDPAATRSSASASFAGPASRLTNNSDSEPRIFPVGLTLLPAVQADHPMSFVSTLRVDGLVRGNRIKPRAKFSAGLELTAFQVHLQKGTLECVLSHSGIPQVATQVAIQLCARTDAPTFRIPSDRFPCNIGPAGPHCSIATRPRGPEMACLNFFFGRVIVLFMAFAPGHAGFNRRSPRWLLYQNYWLRACLWLRLSFQKKCQTGIAAISPLLRAV